MTYLSWKNEQLLNEAKQKFAEGIVILLRFGASRKIIREMMQHVIDEYDKQRREGRSKLIITPEDL